MAREETAVHYDKKVMMITSVRREDKKELKFKKISHERTKRGKKKGRRGKSDAHKRLNE